MKVHLRFLPSLFLWYIFWRRQMDPDQHENMDMSLNPVIDRCDTCSPEKCSECIICHQGWDYCLALYFIHCSSLMLNIYNLHIICILKCGCHSLWYFGFIHYFSQISSIRLLRISFVGNFRQYIFFLDIVTSASRANFFFDKRAFRAIGSFVFFPFLFSVSVFVLIPGFCSIFEERWNLKKIYCRRYKTLVVFVLFF